MILVFATATAIATAIGVCNCDNNNWNSIGVRVLVQGNGTSSSRRCSRNHVGTRRTRSSSSSLFCSSSSYMHRTSWTHQFVSQQACARYSPSRASSRKAARPGTMPAMACHDAVIAVIRVSCCGCRISEAQARSPVPMLERACAC